MYKLLLPPSFTTAAIAISLPCMTCSACCLICIPLLTCISVLKSKNHIFFHCIQCTANRARTNMTIVFNAINCKFEQYFLYLFFSRFFFCVFVFFSVGVAHVWISILITFLFVCLWLFSCCAPFVYTQICATNEMNLNRAFDSFARKPTIYTYKCFMSIHNWEFRHSRFAWKLFQKFLEKPGEFLSFLTIWHFSIQCIHKVVSGAL